MAILIKSFGDQTICSNLNELKQVLLAKYKNMSVSIVYTLPSGIKNTSFVDVLPDGSLKGSYCEQPVPLSCFNF